jgi:inhibitor of cysteine peptidase
MKRLLLMFLIFNLAVPWAMSLNSKDIGEEEMAVFLMSEKGETCVQVRAGQKFAIKFVTSPGTGYSWELAAPLDEKMLAIIETKSEALGSGLLGASEYKIWICRALAAGLTEIALKYVRPWEKDADPVKKHIFKVQIR